MARKPLTQHGKKTPLPGRRSTLVKDLSSLGLPKASRYAEASSDADVDLATFAFLASLTAFLIPEDGSAWIDSRRKRVAEARGLLQAPLRPWSTPKNPAFGKDLARIQEAVVRKTAEDPIAAALERILSAGVAPRDLSIVVRSMQRFIIASVCYLLDAPESSAGEGWTPRAKAARWGLYAEDPKSGQPLKKLRSLHELLPEVEGAE